MPVLSKTTEVDADAASIMAIVADFEAYPQWNEGIKGVWVLARYDDGRPSQLRLDTEVSGFPGTYIQAVYYPGANQIQTVMQQGDLFLKQEQLFSVVEAGDKSLLTVTLVAGIPACILLTVGMKSFRASLGRAVWLAA